MCITDCACVGLYSKGSYLYLRDKNQYELMINFLKTIDLSLCLSLFSL